MRFVARVRNTSGAGAAPGASGEDSLLAVQRPVALDPRPLGARLWTYQAERFSLTRQGPLIVLYALSCVCFGALTRGSPQVPPPESVPIAVIVVFCFFFQLRVADEHRDYDEDLRLRPELPVPRGTITLPELDVFVAGTMAIQLVLSAALHPPLIALLFPPWLWTFLVRNDFFARGFLERHPVASLTIHLAFFPLVTLYAVAADQLTVSGALSPGLAAFLFLSALSAAAIEFARKCRAPEDERPGVITYSNLWGSARAGMITAFALATALVIALFAFLATGAAGWWFLPAAAAGFGAFTAATGYAAKPTRPHARRLLLWTAGLIATTYLSVGILPLVTERLGDMAR